MNKKNSKIIFIFLFFFSFILFSNCRENNNDKKTMEYVTLKENGLQKSVKIDSASKILVTLLPEVVNNNGTLTDTNRLYHFTIQINTIKEKVTDSIYLKYSYNSHQMYKLVENTDTLLPVFSEMMANGRKDINQFTVLFETKKKSDSTQINLLINTLGLSDSTIVINFNNKAINNAYKNLY